MAAGTDLAVAAGTGLAMAAGTGRVASRSTAMEPPAPGRGMTPGEAGHLASPRSCVTGAESTKPCVRRAVTLTALQQSP